MTRKKVTIKKLITIFISIILITTSFAGKASADTSYANFSIERLAGSDRYATSTLLSQYGWNQTSENVVLTTGENFPDSLCAAPLASKLNAPVLLTTGNRLNAYTRNEIMRLCPRNVYIVGGQGVVSLTIENQIKAMHINTIRIAGSDRYETSMMIAKFLGKTSTVFVVTGNDFPDALSVASIAAKVGAPIILSDRDNITKHFKDYLNNNSISQSYVIGGQAIISDNVFNELPNCTRIYGNHRYETNIKILNTFSNELNLTSAFITTGENFPDALSCAPLAGLNSSPIILVSKNKVDVTSDFFKSINSFIKNVIVLGGESIVPSEVIDTSSQGANAKNTLKIPTYDGSNQACHPKVVYFPNGWNGWKYWMSMTPYPNGNDLIENPSIVVSNSGTSWEVPKGISNPITPLPDEKGKHNSDPHLVYNQNTNQLELWYRFTTFDKEDRILKMTSSDGIHWSTPELMLLFQNEQKCFSPAIILENNTYKMWYIDQDFKCMYVESMDEGVHWSNPMELDFNLTDTYVPWHLDVVHTDLGYETVFCGAKKEDLILNLNNRVLFWNVSNNGVNFGKSELILSATNSATAWDNKQIYSSTFVKVDGIYKLFYSAMDETIKWNIGLSQGYNLNDLHGYEGDIK